MQPGAVAGASLDLVAALAKSATGPGVNSPLTTEWYDLSGYARHGTLQTFAGTSGSGWGGSGSVADPYRLTFDGASDYVSLPDISAVDDKSCSYEAWAKTSDASASKFIISEGKNDTKPAAGLLIESDAKCHAWAYDDAGAQVDVASTVSINDGVWHHLVAVFGDSGKIAVYVDGSASGTPLNLPAGGMACDRGGVGALVRSNVINYWNGSIAAARIYPFALSAAQVAQNYAVGMLVRWMTTNPGLW